MKLAQRLMMRGQGGDTSDPYWSAVTCLIQPSGSNIVDAAGGSLFIDGPVVSNGAIYADGVNDRLAVVDNNGLDLGAVWTIDFIFTPVTLPTTTNEMIVTKGSNKGLDSYMFELQTQNRIRTYVSGSSTNPVYRTYIDTGDNSIVVGNEYHVELSRDSENILRIFLNGALKGSTTWTYTPYADDDYLRLCYSRESNADVRHANVYLPCFRITKGICRHTANFTPPSYPLPVE